jgi:glucose/arabinose dehydrogenase
MNTYKYLITLLLITGLGCQAGVTQSGATVMAAASTQIESSPLQQSTSTSVYPAPLTPALTWPTISLNEVITGLTQPLHIAHAGDGSGRLFIVEKTGRIKLYLG